MSANKKYGIDGPNDLFYRLLRIGQKTLDPFKNLCSSIEQKEIGLTIIHLRPSNNLSNGNKAVRLHQMFLRRERNIVYLSIYPKIQ